MNEGAQSVALLAAVMLGMVALAGLISLARYLWSVEQGRRARARVAPGGWTDEPLPPADQAEQACLERWHALLGARGLGDPWHGAAPAAAARPRRTRILAGALMLAALPAGYFSWMLLKPPPRVLEDPEEILTLVSIEKWADAVSMFEDKLRVRFEYRNLGTRCVDAFSVYVRLEDEPGHVVLQDLVSVSNPVAPGGTSSWTQTYWSTCKQVRSTDAWAGLLQKDMNAYTVEWRPVGLVYDDGEGRTTLGQMPEDSILEIGR
jgi:hypothetical protein